jgi:hypothetical protein
METAELFAFVQAVEAKSLSRAASAEASVRAADNVMRGDLRVSVPPALDTSFATMVATFAKLYPEVRVRILAWASTREWSTSERATTSRSPSLKARARAPGPPTRITPPRSTRAVMPPCPRTAWKPPGPSVSSIF